jgi:hypothetical protein
MGTKMVVHIDKQVREGLLSVAQTRLGSATTQDRHSVGMQPIVTHENYST